MMSINKKSENNDKWQFWFLVSFSCLLIVTFVFYLPLRFRFGAMHGSEVDNGMDGMEMMGGGEENHEEMNMMSSGEAAGGYHEEGDVKEGLAVHFGGKFGAFSTGISNRLEFCVEKEPNFALSVSELEPDHTKLMHVIGVRNDLNEFFHIHPAPVLRENYLASDSCLAYDYTFKKPGRYKIWSEVKKDGVNHAFGHPEIIVEGEGPKEEGEVSFGRNVIAGGYQVALDVSEPVRAGRPTDLYFDIHSLTGGEVEVEPYLAADMHLTIIKKDWSEFIHTHPESAGAEHGHSSFLPPLKAYAHGGIDDEAEHNAHSRDEEIHFQTTLPSPGLYKAFAQFRPKGTDLPPDEALVAGFWIEAKEDAGFRFPVKLGLFLVSIIAIAGLGLGVKRFLKVKI